MPHSDISPRAKPGSPSPATPPPKAAPPSPQFAESQQESSPDGPNRPEKPPDSDEWLSLDATEPFPDDLFRVPVPNAVFGRMPGLSDSALRCLLALIHLSFRFDPAESEWVHAGDWFARSDIEDETSLSSQGVRNGLSELESIGWARADRTGRSHRYQLELEVPNRCFTYVPTALLEHTGEIGAGTELRVVLTVLRGTWGWTQKEADPQSGSVQVVHDRWASLSNRQLAEATGRSETAVGQAAKALQEVWIERVRPGSGPHQYRFLPEAVGDTSGDGSKDSGSSGGPTANDLAPDRQKSGTPTFSKKNSSKDKHSQPRKKESPTPTGAAGAGNNRAVPTENNSRREPDHQERTTTSRHQEESPGPDFSDLSSEKQELAEKLANVGVWAGRIAELLSRFSQRRIRANFELYRRRAAEQTIRKPGAWLYEAITVGYVLPSPNPDGPISPPDGSSLSLQHQQTVSETEKERCVDQGISEDCFHRCVSPKDNPDGPTYMYFDPGRKGPTRRT